MIHRLRQWRIIPVSILTFVTLSFQNCMSSHDVTSDVSSSSLANNERISAGALGVLQAKCSGCHNPTSTEATPIPDILDIEGMTTDGWVVPGAPQNSPIYTSIIDGLMPKNGTLTSTEMDLVRDWIIVLGGGDPTANPNGDTSDTGGTTTTPAPQTGTILYNTYCASCHGVGTASSKKGRSATQITNAIGSVPTMMNLSNALTATQIQAIATYLGSI